MANRGSRKKGSSKPKDPTPAKTAEGPVVTSSDPNVQPYLNALNHLANGDKGVGSGLAGGAELGSLLFANQLGRVDEGMTPEQGEILARMKDESFKGGNQQSPEVTQALQLQQQAAQSSSINDPNVQGAIAALRGASDSSQTSNPAIQAALARSGQLATDASTMDPRLTEILNLRQQALGGLNTEQMTAAREDAQSGINRGASTAMRTLAMGQAGSGMRGAARGIGAVPITQQFADAQQGLERKLILDQKTAQDNALNAYSGDAQTIGNSFMANRLAANNADSQTIQGFNTGALNGANAYATGLNNINQTAAGTAQQFGNSSQAANQFMIKDRSDRFNNYVNYFNGLRSDLYARQLQNMNLAAQEKSGMVSAIFGGGSFGAEQTGRQESFELAKDNLDLQKDIYGKGGGGGGGGGGSGGGSSSSSFGSGGDSFA